jgi:hypothetical protein
LFGRNPLWRRTFERRDPRDRRETALQGRNPRQLTELPPVTDKFPEKRFPAPSSGSPPQRVPAESSESDKVVSPDYSIRI